LALSLSSLSWLLHDGIFIARGNKKRRRTYSFILHLAGPKTLYLLFQQECRREQV
jgi:hypothetical protein